MYRDKKNVKFPELTDQEVVVGLFASLLLHPEDSLDWVLSVVEVGVETVDLG